MSERQTELAVVLPFRKRHVEQIAGQLVNLDLLDDVELDLLEQHTLDNKRDAAHEHDVVVDYRNNERGTEL